MTEVYCRTCKEFTPLAVEDMQTQPNNDIVAGSLVCPQCYSILVTLKVKEEGIYTFQKVAALEVPRPLPKPEEGFCAMAFWPPGHAQKHSFKRSMGARLRLFCLGWFNETAAHILMSGTLAGLHPCGKYC